MSDQPGGSLSGLNQNEAREFHALFVTSFVVFTGIACIAHFLVFLWRPWFPGVDGYSMMNGVSEKLTAAISYLA